MISNEEHIIQLLGKKDESAIDLIYDQYGGNLYGYLLQMLKSEEEAQDVLQNSFVKIWNNAEKFDSSKAKLFTWLLSICRNTAIDRIRSKNKRQENEIQRQKSDVYTNNWVYINEDAVDLREKVEELEPQYKAVIEALFFGGMTQKEASEYLDIPLGTVKTRLKIALRKLQKIFSFKRKVISILLLLSWMIG